MPNMAFLPASSATRRLCVCISDIHCTDGTVGNQTGESDDWAHLFDEIRGASMGAEELVIVLNGDIIDLIRSGRWTEAGVYPWQRDHPQFPAVLMAIMREIVARHAEPNGMQGQDGFFCQLKRLVTELASREPAPVSVRIVPIVGNHDKELLVHNDARSLFYSACLGWTDGLPDADYAHWVDAMYGPKVQASPPWLPFYYGDLGFQLFATHGQWRDSANCRDIAGWHCRQGWQPAMWQADGYAPFTEPCLGDTIAAGLLSGFIWDAKQKLAARRANITAEARRVDHDAVERIAAILDEMDLYRPALKGILRIMEEARRQRKADVDQAIIQIVTDTFRANLVRWLEQDAPRIFASPGLCWALRLLALLARMWNETVILWVLKQVARSQEPEQTISVPTLLSLPGLSAAYRDFGFRLHVEGHTHVALQADLAFERPAAAASYTYVNLGAWRSQIHPKANNPMSYRRRGIARALFIASERVEADRHEVRYWVLDITRWGGHHDDLGMHRNDPAHGWRTAPDR